ncbi:MAG: hypothetical protein A2X49_03770 [Lentisphaerae bacterium GWF2_52_8]|nr:MAG: hypothetical protein A2X49_03770 [Lentisphaerae bacterium GWF2_52_8]
MKGCHNCEHAGIAFENYETSPCSSCQSIKDPSPLGRKSFEEVCFAEEYAVHPVYEIEKNTHDEMLGALASCVTMLIELHEKHPDTFQIAMTKIKDPNLSYSEIAKLFNCRKQNIYYHLRKAVSLCSGLEHAMLIDRRFARKEYVYDKEDNDIDGSFDGDCFDLTEVEMEELELVQGFDD